jgi:hypothetical protein
MSVKKYHFKGSVSSDVYVNHQTVKRVFPYEKTLYVETVDGFDVVTKGIPEGGAVCSMKNIDIPNTPVNFSLRVNLVKRDKVTGKRVPVTCPISALSWIQNKASESGFSVSGVEVLFDALRQGRKHDMYLSFNSVVFRGTLTVTDKSLFEDSVYNGFGPAKSFGFGALVWKNESI